MGHHEREQESHVPSRRAALRTIGLTSLLAAVPITAAALAAESQPDAELIALGKEFDRLHAAWIPLWRAHWQAWAQVRVVLENEGMTDLVYAKACRLCRVDETAHECDVVEVPLVLLSNRIRDLPARTVAGLSVKARVAFTEIFSPRQYDGVSERDMDCEVACYIRFMREIAAMAGEAQA